MNQLGHRSSTPHRAGIVLDGQYRTNINAAKCVGRKWTRKVSPSIVRRKVAITFLSVSKQNRPQHLQSVLNRSRLETNHERMILSLTNILFWSPESWTVRLAVNCGSSEKAGLHMACHRSGNLTMKNSLKAQHLMKGNCSSLGTGPWKHCLSSMRSKREKATMMIP